MAGVRFFEKDGKQFLEIDYADLNEQEMIDLISKAAELLKQKETPVYVLALHRKNFIKSAFIQHAKVVTSPILHLIKKMAFVGLTPTQSLILKGYSIFFRKNFKVFATYEEAMNYLLNDKTTDDDLPDYYQTSKK